MLDELSNLNLFRVSTLGFLIMLGSLAVGLAVGIPVFLYLNAEFRGKGVAAIPILTAGFFLLVGVKLGYAASQKSGFRFHKRPVGDVFFIGHKARREAEEELHAFRPFPEMPVPDSGVVVFSQRASASLETLSTEAAASLREALLSRPRQFFWVFTRTEKASAETLTEVLEHADAFLQEYRDKVPEIQFAFDSQNAPEAPRPVLRGWPEIRQLIWTMA